MRLRTHSTLISACSEVQTCLDGVCLCSVFVHKLGYVNVSQFADKSFSSRVSTTSWGSLTETLSEERRHKAERLQIQAMALYANQGVWLAKNPCGLEDITQQPLEYARVPTHRCLCCATSLEADSFCLKFPAVSHFSRPDLVQATI